MGRHFSANNRKRTASTRGIRAVPVVCLVLLALAACTSNKISPENLAMQQKLELRELALEDQLLAADKQRSKLDELAATLAEEREASEEEEKRLQKLERRLKRQAAEKKSAGGKVPSKRTNGEAITLGTFEYIKMYPPGKLLEARMDTGARRSLLGVFDLTEFERDGEPHVRFNIIPKTGAKKIELTREVKDRARMHELNANGKKRPVVNLRVVLGGIDEKIEFILLEDNKAKLSEVSIGRNLLRDLAVVDVSKKHLLETEGP